SHIMEGVEKVEPRPQLRLGNARMPRQAPCRNLRRGLLPLAGLSHAPDMFLVSFSLVGIARRLTPLAVLNLLRRAAATEYESQAGIVMRLRGMHGDQPARSGKRLGIYGGFPLHADATGLRTVL